MERLKETGSETLARIVEKAFKIPDIVKPHTWRRLSKGREHLVHKYSQKSTTNLSKSTNAMLNCTKNQTAAQKTPQ